MTRLCHVVAGVAIACGGRRGDSPDVGDTAPGYDTGPAVDTGETDDTATTDDTGGYEGPCAETLDVRSVKICGSGYADILSYLNLGVADLDQDGDVEIVVGGGNTVSYGSPGVRGTSDEVLEQFDIDGSGFLGDSGTVADFDGDGVPDVAVGDGLWVSDTDDHPTTQGAAWVYLGPITAPPSESDAVARWEGTLSHTRGPLTMAPLHGVGESGGDALAIVFFGYVGLGIESSAVGIVYDPLRDGLISTEDDSVALVRSTGDYHLVGERTEGIDADGDGRDAALVGYMTNNALGYYFGDLHVVDTDARGDLPVTDYPAFLDTPADDHSLYVNDFSVGDSNGDGYDDLVLKYVAVAAGEYRWGLFLGPVAGMSSYTSASAWLIDDEVGRVENGTGLVAGDVDGDGRSGDITISREYGMPGDEDRSWLAVASSPVAGTVDLRTLEIVAGPDREAEFGRWMITGAGDVDEDGYDDLLVGAPLDSEVDEQSGAVWLIYGGW